MIKGYCCKFEILSLKYVLSVVQTYTWQKRSGCSTVNADCPESIKVDQRLSRTLDVVKICMCFTACKDWTDGRPQMQAFFSKLWIKGITSCPHGVGSMWKKLMKPNNSVWCDSFKLNHSGEIQKTSQKKDGCSKRLFHFS